MALPVRVGWRRPHTVTEFYEVRWIPTWARILDVLLNRHKELLKGMHTTLERLKAATESTQHGTPAPRSSTRRQGHKDRSHCHALRRRRSSGTSSLDGMPTRRKGLGLYLARACCRESHRPGVRCHCNDSRVLLPWPTPGSNLSKCPRV